MAHGSWVTFEKLMMKNDFFYSTKSFRAESSLIDFIKTNFGK